MIGYLPAAAPENRGTISTAWSRTPSRIGISVSRRSYWNEVTGAGESCGRGEGNGSAGRCGVRLDGGMSPPGCTAGCTCAVVASGRVSASSANRVKGMRFRIVAALITSPARTGNRRNPHHSAGLQRLAVSGASMTRDETSFDTATRIAAGDDGTNYDNVAIAL